MRTSSKLASFLLLVTTLLLLLGFIRTAGYLLLAAIVTFLVCNRPPGWALGLLSALLFTLPFLINQSCSAKKVLTVEQLQFKSIFAMKPGEPNNIYSILGTGAIRALRTRDSESVVSSWIKDHPHAHVIEVSEMSPIMQNGTGTDIYIWIIDRKENLNIRLVRDGVFPAGVMYDAIDFFEQLKDSGINLTKEKHNMRRLVNENQYQDFLKKVEEAEKMAKGEKKGIWSDNYKEERESDGIE